MRHFNLSEWAVVHRPYIVFLIIGTLLVGLDVVIEATVRRSRPVVLTAAAAVLAMVPVAGSVFWGPMAIAIMGGLIVGTVLTLVFVPALYAAWFRVRSTVDASGSAADPLPVPSAH
jgi:Cu/Ag efflux pump CusA